MRRCLQTASDGLSHGRVFGGLPLVWPCGRRYIRISTIPSGTLDDLPVEAPDISNAASPDARFEVLGGPNSLLSVSLAASQNLYTRRGTLIGIGGKAENAISTLSLQKPFGRALLGLPFLFQKLSSTTPLTALISTNGSFAVVHLDGSKDWRIPGKALLAWTGQSLTVKPTVNWGQSLEHVGASEVTGRGLLAIVGRGSVYQVVLKAEESYVIHPSNVIAYTIDSAPPSPYRLKSTSLQIPRVDKATYLPDTKFFRVIRETWTWKTLRKSIYSFQAWSRRTFWGDRLFLQFHGPSTILLQSQASRLADNLSSDEVNEIAKTPPGAVHAAMKKLSDKNGPGDSAAQEPSLPESKSTPRMNIASIGPDRKVKFEAAKEENK